MSKHFISIFGLSVSITLVVLNLFQDLPIAHALTYVDLIGDFCAQQMTVAGQATQNKWNIYDAQYCGMEKYMEDEVLTRVARQLEVKQFFGILLDTEILKKVIDGKEIDFTDLPEALQKKYFTNKLEDKAKFYELVSDLYQQEQAIQWTKDSLAAEFRASEVWANGSLGDSPFDLVNDLNLIEVLLFGSKAVITGPHDVYNWPMNEEEETAAPPAAGLLPPAPSTATGTQPPPGQENNAGRARTGGGPPPAPENCVPETVPAENGPPQGPPAGSSGAGRSGTQTPPPSDCAGSGGLKFKSYQPQNPSPPSGDLGAQLSPQSSSQDASSQQCPPGSRPRRQGEPSPPPAHAQPGAGPQAQPNVPVPFIGGVLKELGPNTRPDCPPPGMEIEVNMAGHVEKRCIDWVPCADYNTTRRWLRGMGASEADADAVEAAFCVTVDKADRPETTYPPDDGCVACHVEHINDILAKAHEQNVTPLSNPLMAFGSSSKFGPALYFNLTVAAKNLFHFLFPGNMPKIEDIQHQAEMAEQSAKMQLDPNKDRPKPLENIIEPTLTLEEVIREDQGTEQKQKKEFSDKLQEVQMQIDRSGQTDYWRSVKAALDQWKGSFESINNRLLSLAASLKFKDKEQCKAK